MRKKILSWFFIFLFFVPALAWSRSRPRRAPREEPIIVAAASSFSYALGDVARGFMAKTHKRVRVVYGSSGLIARQIERGAPFDVFISANSGFMEELARARALRPGSLRKFASGVLVIAYKEGEGRGISDIKGLLDKKIKKVAMANPAHAPYGKAAVEALEKAGLFKKVRKKLVYGENVRQALQFIESGNAGAGFVALSIARGKGIKTIPVDPALYSPIIQTAAVMRSTRHVKEASEFINYLTGPEGLKALEKYGFMRP